jgi:hypothetical protein
MFPSRLLRGTFEQVAPQTFTLYDPNDSNKVVASIVIEVRYVPVPVELEPRETVSSKYGWIEP